MGWPKRSGGQSAGPSMASATFTAPPTSCHSMRKSMRCACCIFLPHGLHACYHMMHISQAQLWCDQAARMMPAHLRSKHFHQWRMLQEPMCPAGDNSRPFGKAPSGLQSQDQVGRQCQHGRPARVHPVRPLPMALRMIRCPAKPGVMKQTESLHSTKAKCATVQTALTNCQKVSCAHVLLQRQAAGCAAGRHPGPGCGSQAERDDAPDSHRPVPGSLLSGSQHHCPAARRRRGERWLMHDTLSMSVCTAPQS